MSPELQPHEPNKAVRIGNQPTGGFLFLENPERC